VGIILRKSIPEPSDATNEAADKGMIFILIGSARGVSSSSHGYSVLSAAASTGERERCGVRWPFLSGCKR
jgi:hypothetical protein